MDHKLDTKTITILVPALNEEALIETTIKELISASRENLDQFEIIIFNDGSTDNTADIIERLAKEFIEVRTVHHEQTKGIGNSVHEGIQLASFDFFMGIPGDHSYPIDTITNMYKEIGMADYVIGYRKNRRMNLPFYRYLISTILVTFVSLLSGRGFELYDYSSPAIYPVDILRNLELCESGYAFQIEMTVKLLRTGVSLKQIPIDMNLANGKSSGALKFSTLRDVLRVLWDLLIN